ALLRAHRRGVEVKLIADKTTPCGRNSGIDPLASAGVPVWIDHIARIAHAKTMVIDGTVTLNGSYNWTRGASGNSEDLNLVASPVVAAAYAAHWRDRQAVSLALRPTRGLVPSRYALSLRRRLARDWATVPLWFPSA